MTGRGKTRGGMGKEDCRERDDFQEVLSVSLERKQGRLVDWEKEDKRRNWEGRRKEGKQ